MEERKTAAIVLGIVALIIIFITAILPGARHRGTQTIAFRNCAVHFNYNDEEVSDSDVYRASQNKLAHCLCNSYRRKPDTAIGNRIVQIYRQYGNRYIDSLGRFNNLDSIIKHKSDLLDTLILVE